MQQGFVSLNDISLLILDECHHAKKDHPYARIMKDYYLAAEKEIQRPRIFGMTASPVDARADVREASEALEMLLNAKIATTSNLSLDRHVHRPEEDVWKYDKLREEFETDLYREVSSLCRVKELERVKKYARGATSQLGEWCADYVWLLALNGQEAMKKERSVERRWGSRNGNVEDKDTETDSIRKALDVVRRWSYRDPKPNLEDLSPKVLLLYEKLSEFFGPRADAQCIVFVEQRHTATVLSKLFDRMTVRNLRPGVLVGINSGEMSDMNSSFRQQAIAMKAFRDGEINCLFATSVAEEGIDIPGCNLVIRFDLYKNLIEYMQSRGRARRQDSRYAHMVELRNPKHRDIYDEVTESERILLQYCKSLDRDRLLDIEVYSDHLNKIQHEESYKKTVTIKATGAKLTTGNSLSVLERYASSLQYENVAFNRVLYNARTEGKMFQYKIGLPEESPVQGIAGDVLPSKKHAKRSAAFKTCLALRARGLLDVYWNTVYHKRRPEMANARLAITSKRKDQYAMLTKPQFWDLACGQKPELLYVMTIHVVPSQPLRRQPAPLALLTRVSLPTIPTFPVYLEEDIESQVITKSASPTINVNPKLLDLLTDFTFQIFRDIFNKNFQRDDSRMPYWLAPVRFAKDPRSSTKTSEVDLDALNDLSLGRRRQWIPGTSTRLWSDAFLVDPLDGRYRYFSSTTIPGLGPWSSVPNGVPFRKDRMSSLIEYTCSLYPKRRPDFLKNRLDPNQPVLAAELVELRRNFLDRKPTVEQKSGNLMVQICPQTLEPSPLPISVVAACLAFPAISSRLESYLIAVEATRSLGLDIPAEWALEALTKDSDNTEEHQAEQIHVQRGMGKNYERLEFLGDAFLKMATSISLFVNNPKNDEYDFHVQRMTLICNQNLFDGAVHEDLQLTKYIRTQGFNRDFWYPKNLTLEEGRRLKSFEVKHGLGMKSVADVCEAIIGAALLAARQAGNLDMAVKAVSRIVHNDNHKMISWQEYSAHYEIPAYQTETPDGYDKLLVSKLSERLGYKFRYPRLLRSAMTHPSVSWSTIPNYQRLEFLGDALFDMVAIEWIFHRFPNRDPQWLTEHKMAMVSNKFLAAVSVELELDKVIDYNGVAVADQIARYSRDVRAALEVGLDSLERDYWTAFEHPPKCLSDIVESYIGAIFVDSDLDFGVVENFIRKYILWHFEDMSIYDTFANAHPTTFLYKCLTDTYGCMEFRLRNGEPHRDDGGVPIVLAALLIHNEVCHSSPKI